MHDWRGLQGGLCHLPLDNGQARCEVWTTAWASHHHRRHGGWHLRHCLPEPHHYQQHAKLNDCHIHVRMCAAPVSQQVHTLCSTIRSVRYTLTLTLTRLQDGACGHHPRPREGGWRLAMHRPRESIPSRDRSLLKLPLRAGLGCSLISLRGVGVRVCVCVCDQCVCVYLCMTCVYRWYRRVRFIICLTESICLFVGHLLSILLCHPR